MNMETEWHLHCAYDCCGMHSFKRFETCEWCGRWWIQWIRAYRQGVCECWEENDLLDSDREIVL